MTAERGAAPWATDRGELDDARVRAAIEAQFPDLRPAAVRFLARGWDHDAWLANETWVFRFPRRADVAAGVATQIELSQLLALALPVAIPRAERIGRPDEHFPYPFAGHRNLGGVPADSVALTASESTALAHELGRVLSALHAVPPSRVASLGLPLLPDRSAERRASLAEVAGAFRLAMPRASVARWEPWLRNEVPAPPPREGPVCLTHNDLAAEHVLIDPATRRIAGIFDWSDAALGDPAVDLVGFWLWKGEAFVRRILESYAASWDEAAIERVRFSARSLAILYVARAHSFGDRELIEKERRWFLEVFEPHER